MGKFKGIWGVLVAACLCGYVWASSVPQDFLNDIEFSIWSEFVPYSELQTHLDTLAQSKVNLLVAVREDLLDQNGFSLKEYCSLANAARRKNVGLRPWLLLSEKNEYWFNKSNVSAARNFVFTFLDRIQKECGQKPEWLVFDIESPKRLSLDLLKQDSDRSPLLFAIVAYDELVMELNAIGVKVQAVTSHFVLNEGKSDPYRVQSAKSIPFRGVHWNEVSFMLYKAEFEDKVKPFGAKINFSSGITYAYAKRAMKNYASMYGAENIAISLGEIGEVKYPVPFQGLRKPFELYYDLRAIHHAGIRKVHLYSLDGFLSMNGSLEDNLSNWLSINDDDAREAHERVNLPSYVVIKGIDALFKLFFRPSDYLNERAH